MPEVTSDEIGRRKFQIQKEKSVEIAVDKVRLNLGSAWRSFSSSDIDVLKYILGEAWVSTDRDTWEKYAFARLTEEDIWELISIGRNLKNQQKRENVALEEINVLLGSTL